jgi:leucyl aminopeptidase
MSHTIKTGRLPKLSTSCLVLGVFTRQRLSDTAQALGEDASGYLERMLKQSALQGDAEQVLMLHEVPGIEAERVLLVGCGKRKEYNLAVYRKSSAAALAALEEARVREAVWTLHQDLPRDADGYRTVRDTVLTAAERGYRFDQLKSKPKPRPKPLKGLGFWLGDNRERDAVERALTHGQAAAAGVQLAKDLGNLPGNICTPGYLADQARELARRYPRLQARVLEEKEMEELGMGALLAVSRGSREPARLIVLEYGGGEEGDRPVVLVGKGLTFDAGGISIKPAEAMDEMKFDMCGGASVLGTLRACAEMQLPINLVGVVPSSENLPDGAANKPGDILTSLSGQTIEVLNTDAEGRLILCDALTYSERFKPALIIDIATLTGACIVALGKHASGLFSNDDDLARELLDAGTHIGDRAWQLPLWDDYQSQLDSPFADMANIGGRQAGSVTAACFLSRFTKKLRWAHLDVAGTASQGGDQKGATGRPVPLLTQFLLQRCKLIP